ncbi:alpha/beta hydrolase-fold protein [Halothiobacillus sp.]|uniref:alpha/beta hydrolase-fold protein n=1 Tax=Halothiobacillus sp. TaxID=1891311 RepID=UPI0026081188|nr:alpha/beta hydrolase-fold protein [Halothiobacillus sp.]MDD4965746.1 alpha/beta fold hydrolase [Halothiobacillus sp.]
MTSKVISTTSPGPTPEGRVIKDTVFSASLEGNLLGDPVTRNVTVYLPPGYDNGDRFPVVYLLHGWLGDETLFMNRDLLYWNFFPAGSDFPDKGIAGMLDGLISQGKLREMVVVMPDGGNKYGGSFYTNSAVAGNYEDYIAEDLVHHIDSHYRTLPDRDSRAIVGHSMGGYGAFKLAMKRPDVFGMVAAHAGVVSLEHFKPFVPAVIGENSDATKGPNPEFAQDFSAEKPMTSMFLSMSAAFSPNAEKPPTFVDLPFEYPAGRLLDEVWDRWTAHDMAVMPRAYSDNLSSLKAIYMDVGDKDELGAALQVEKLHQALTGAGVAHQYEVYDGGHTSKAFERLSISLSFISNHLTGAVILHGYSLPYGHRIGYYDACVGKLTQREMNYETDFPALVETEKGEILVCQSLPRSDLCIEVQEVEHGKDIEIKQLSCKIAKKELLSHDVMRLYLELPDSQRLQFFAGQYLDVLLKDGRRRSFSIANAPHDDKYLELHIRHVEGSEYTHFIFHELKEKSIWQIVAPLGSCYLREDSERPIILMGGGTGFAPLKGMVEHAFFIGETRPIRLFWGVRALRDLYLSDLPRQWEKDHPNFKFTPVLSDPLPEDQWTGESGWVHDAVVRACPDMSGYDVYISGPPVMIRVSEQAFLAQGLPERRLFSDALEFNRSPMQQVASALDGKGRE